MTAEAALPPPPPAGADVASAAAAPEAADGAAEASQVHLVSWNVAGWKTTLEQIKRFRGGLSGFFKGHRIDILCLQEVKLTSKALAADAQKLGAEVPGYESFWACNEGGGAQRQGLNGVATFARQGLVLRADSKPLLDEDLDSEGRCLMTDHGDFVVFNVYVPNSAGGPRLPFKLRWLRALRAAMGRAREAGKAVILAGDLNMKNRVVDSHWSFRTLDVLSLRDRVLAAEQAAVVPGAELAAPQQPWAPAGRTLGPEARQAVEAICTEWPTISAALRDKEVRPFETRNAQKGQTFQRWGVFAKARSGDLVRLGSPYETEECARGSFLVDGSGVDQDGTVVIGQQSQEATYALQKPGCLPVGELAECLPKLAGRDFSQAALKEVSDAFGQPQMAPALRGWFDGVLANDGMVDTFAETHPAAEERFTCWDQYKNKRHENVGARIDYVLADRSLFERRVARGAALEARGKVPPESPAAALAAATLGGLSRPSSFAGGGIPRLDDDEYFAQFREEGSTGMIYTPPQLSDHVAVSLLLSGCPQPAPEGGAASKDAATAACQPHRTAKRITDFFGRKPEGGGPPAKRFAGAAA